MRLLGPMSLDAQGARVLAFRDPQVFLELYESVFFHL